MKSIHVHSSLVERYKMKHSNSLKIFPQPLHEEQVPDYNKTKNENLKKERKEKKEKKEKKWARVKRYTCKWATNVTKWFVGVPAEFACAYGHVAMCFGCCGRFGNPVTPILEEVPYDDMYNDKFTTSMSFFMSGIMSILRMLCCICTMAGCCGIVCSPKDGASIVKYD